MPKYVLAFFIGLLIQACAAPPPALTPTQSAEPVYTVTVTATATLTPTPTISPTPTLQPGKAERVVIFSFDGMRADAIAEAPMDNLMRWMREGAYTLDARTIAPSLTLPSHASMISGLCANQHGITWNTGLIEWGYSKGVDIFDLAHAAGLKTVLITGKDKLRALAQPETTDVFEVHPHDADIVQAAIEQIPLGFNLMLVHIPSADDRGHQYGWMTNAQLKALRESDELFGQFIAALNQSGLAQTTLVIVTADHGGHNREHEGSQIVDQRIPWAIVGPGVEAERLTNLVSVTDTAATVAYALDLPLQPEWAGIPVYEAFGIPAPKIHESVPCRRHGE